MRAKTTSSSGTDYGHTDPFSNVRALKVFADRADLSDRSKKKIIRDNALAFYGLKESDLPVYVDPSQTGRGLEEGRASGVSL